MEELTPFHFNPPSKIPTSCKIPPNRGIYWVLLYHLSENKWDIYSSSSQSFFFLPLCLVSLLCLSEIQELSSPLLMESRGLKELLEQQSISKESPPESDSSWRMVIQEPSSPLLMETRGLKEPLEHQCISEESPTLNNLPPP